MGTELDRGHALVVAVRRTWIPLVLTFVLAYSWMYSDITVPNERSRIYLAVAMVDHHELTIDQPVHRFGPVNDWARREGHLYTDKAPGASLLAAGIYWVVRLFSSEASWTIDELINLVRSWVMIPLALLGFLALRRLLGLLGISAYATDLAAIAWMLGSPAFHYSGAFYGHQLVSVAFVVSLMLILQWEERDVSGVASWHDHLGALAAGACLGYAALVEYQAAPVVVLMFVYVLAGPMRKNGLLIASFVAGVVPWVVLSLAYNWIAFGGPLELSYAHLVDPRIQALHANKIGGIGVPHWAYMDGILLSLHRGLLASSPIIALAVPGLVIMARRGRLRLSLLVAAVFGAYLIVVAGSDAWFGGWSFSARLLVPSLGLASISVAFCVDALERWGAGRWLSVTLALVGTMSHQAVHLAFPEPPPDATNPLRDVVVPAFERSLLSPNLAGKYGGWNDGWSALPLAVAVVLLLGWTSWVAAHEDTQRRIWVELLLFGAALVVAASVVGFIATECDAGWSPRKIDGWMSWVARLAVSEHKIWAR